MPTSRVSTYQGYVPCQTHIIEALITRQNCVFDKTSIEVRKELSVSKGVMCRGARRLAEMLCVILGGDDTFSRPTSAFNTSQNSEDDMYTLSVSLTEHTGKFKMDLQSGPKKNAGHQSGCRNAQSSLSMDGSGKSNARLVSSDVRITSC
jgi:hypothetical protein